MKTNWSAIPAALAGILLCAGPSLARAETPVEIAALAARSNALLSALVKNAQVRHEHKELHAAYIEVIDQFDGETARIQAVTEAAPRMRKVFGESRNVDAAVTVIERYLKAFQDITSVYQETLLPHQSTIDRLRREEPYSEERLAGTLVSITYHNLTRAWAESLKELHGLAADVRAADPRVISEDALKDLEYGAVMELARGDWDRFNRDIDALAFDLAAPPEIRQLLTSLKEFMTFNRPESR